MMGLCRPKHVERLRHFGIINSTTRLHLVGSFYETIGRLTYSERERERETSPFTKIVPL